jgi:hypothetical protein
MTISAYQADNIIKTYSKQSKARFRLADQHSSSPDRYADLVTLSGSGSISADANQKISYSLLDVLLKEKKIAP